MNGIQSSKPIKDNGNQLKFLINIDRNRKRNMKRNTKRNRNRKPKEQKGYKDRNATWKTSTEKKEDL